MRRLLIACAVTAVFTATSNVAELRASDNLNSTMTALCVDLGCSQITFSLNVSGQVYLNNLYMRSLDATLFKFGSVAAVFDAQMNDVSSNWLPGSMVSQDEMQLISGSATFAAEPVHFIVDMIQPPNGTQSDLDGSIWFYANGYSTMNPDGTGNDRYSTSGVVTTTPEPGTSLMLATGLLGLVGIARRRRERDLLAEDEAGPHARSTAP